MTRSAKLTVGFVLSCLFAISSPLRADDGAAKSRPSRQYTIEQFLATTMISSPAISADGSHVLFTSDASGIPNVYTVPFAGGEAVPLTRSTTDSTFAVSYFPKDDRVLFTHDRGGNEQNHLYVLDKGALTDLTPGEKLKAEFAGWSHDDSAFFVITNQRDPRFFDIYRHDAGDYKRTLLYENPGGYLPSEVSGDGRFVALDKPKTTSDSDIYLWDTRSRVLTHVSPHSGAATFRTAEFDPDSKWLYYLTNQGGEFMRVRRYELATGKHEDVESADWDIVFTRFSRNGRYRVTAVNEDGRTVIRLHETRTGKLVAPPRLPEGDVTSVVISRNEDRMVISLAGDRSPTNLYAASIGGTEATRLTNSLSKEINPEDLVDSRVVRFKAADGMTIPSIFWKPRQASPEHKVAAMVWVHGGPGGQTRKGYNALIQYLVNHGYAVLGINNRGSSGYGQKFFVADDRKHGREPLRDCVNAKDYLSGMPDIEPGKIGIIGGSYGGYMVLAALAFEPTSFVLGVDIFGVSNWLRTLESIPPYWEAQRQALYQEIGDPGKDRAMLMAISPVFHADKIRRPLMVLQGRNDPRVIKAESDDIVDAVRVRRRAGPVPRLRRRGPRFHQEEEPDRRLPGHLAIHQQEHVVKRAVAGRAVTRGTRLGQTEARRDSRRTPAPGNATIGNRRVGTAHRETPAPSVRLCAVRSSTEKKFRKKSQVQSAHGPPPRFPLKNGIGASSESVNRRILYIDTIENSVRPSRGPHSLLNLHNKTKTAEDARPYTERTKVTFENRFLRAVRGSDHRPTNGTGPFAKSCQRVPGSATQKVLSRLPQVSIP